MEQENGPLGSIPTKIGSVAVYPLLMAPSTSCISAAE